MMRFFRSSDTRLRSGFYDKYGVRVCCLVEKTRSGMLVTELNERGLVEKQVYLKPEDSDYKELVNSIESVDSGEYSGIVVDAKCAGCGGNVVRELDLVHPYSINSVPVVPLFICRTCGKRHFSMTDNYLRSLVHEKKDMFDEKDLKELKDDEDVFVGTLQEYIIRIFASKKISRIR